MISQVLTVFILLLSSFQVFSSPAHEADQDFRMSKPKTGDLVFLNLTCPLCEAIENVTIAQFVRLNPRLRADQLPRWSHVGIVSVEEDGIQIYDAYPPKVRRSSPEEFFSALDQQDTQGPWGLGRVRGLTKGQARRIVEGARERLGLDYDASFIFGDDKYYCSELVATTFGEALWQPSFFPMLPMSYGKQGTPTEADLKVWRDYFAGRGEMIPEGKPGLSPLGIWLSPRVSHIVAPPVGTPE